MSELNDHELLAEFVRNRSEEAFAALTARHVNLVYSAALRFTGNPHHAEEISQAVFVILARKAASLPRGTSLSGWLYQTARLTAANFMKGEIRRQRREQEAYMQSSLNEPDTAAWEKIAPLLDDAMGDLAETDRNAVVLRFFENKTAGEVAAEMKLTEATAQKRLTRALGRLRKIFARRGVTLTTTIIAGAVSVHSVQAAPVGLAATIASAAARSTTLTASIAALVKSTLKTMLWAKVKFAMSVSVATLALGGAAGIVVHACLPEAPQNPALARQMLPAIFSHLSAPLPPQMRFVAEVENVNKPWSNAQISNEVYKTEEFIFKNEQKASGKRQPDMAKAWKQWLDRSKGAIALNMESVRLAHSTRTFVEQEWLAGGLWRLDHKETSEISDELRAAEKPLPAGIEYQNTTIQINDPAFAEWHSCRIDHRMRWAVYDNANWGKEKFWEAQTLEPELGFILFFAASDYRANMKALQSRSKWEQGLDTFSGMKPDPARMEALATGKSLFWRVETGETNIAGRKLSILRLKGRYFSPAHGEEVAFFADANNLTNIYRIELTAMILMKTPHISIRDDFDTNGFPHTWIIETPKDETTKKIVKFKEAEFHAQFDNQVEFQPKIPTGYNITGNPPR